jgi:type IV pilus biogenesis protein CpaD/CtpE
MKAGIAPIARLLACAVVMLLAACATRAPDFGGRWREANAYAETTQEIPLQQAYVYAPSPMDGTLRNMLQRWAHDAGLRLQYEHHSDYTLHAAVARIRTPDLQQATALLNQAYAAQRISVTVVDGSLAVRPVDDAALASKP